MEKTVVFTCPQCGGHKLKRIDTVLYEMDACLDSASGSVLGISSNEETTKVDTVYKCASCGKQLTDKEVYVNVERVNAPEEEAHICIDFTLHTDGDYGLSNCNKWGAKQYDYGEADYKGHVEFSGDSMRQNAVAFLWDMLCTNDGLHTCSSHRSIMRDFYDMFDKLEDDIFAMNNANRRAEGVLWGNQEGTEFVVTLVGDVSKLDW